VAFGATTGRAVVVRIRTGLPQRARAGPASSPPLPLTDVIGAGVDDDQIPIRHALCATSWGSSRRSVLSRERGLRKLTGVKRNPAHRRRPGEPRLTEFVEFKGVDRKRRRASGSGSMIQFVVRNRNTREKLTSAGGKIQSVGEQVNPARAAHHRPRPEQLLLILQQQPAQSRRLAAGGGGSRQDGAPTFPGPRAKVGP
jgi:hypothetical protein